MLSNTFPFVSNWQTAYPQCALRYVFDLYVSTSKRSIPNAVVVLTYQLSTLTNLNKAVSFLVYKSLRYFRCSVVVIHLAEYLLSWYWYWTIITITFCFYCWYFTGRTRSSSCTKSPSNSNSTSHCLPLLQDRTIWVTSQTTLIQA